MKDGWIIYENSLIEQELIKNESIFNVSNGYIGARGCFEEGYPDNYQTVRGNYINGYYEIVPIQYSEKAYAFPEKMQKIVNVMDAQGVNIIIGRDKFSLFEGTVKSFERYLDMEAGLYVRDIWWVSPSGKELRIKITRLASLKHLELFVINYEIEKVNFEDEIIIESWIDADVRNFIDANDPRVSSAHSNILSVKSISEDNGVMQIVSESQNSKQVVAIAVKHCINVDFYAWGEQTYKTIKTSFKINKGKDKINFTKYNVYTDSRRYKNPASEGYELVNKLSDITFELLKQEQKYYLDDFWNLADINIEGDEKLQQGLRYNLYELLQSVGKDAVSNIAAKGLSGEGYEGHYFWDTEIYIIPFFTLCCPELAKGLLKYRFTILDSARRRAKELGHKKGAAYSWRTIDGEECSSYFPAGTAQYHINADIAYAFVQYYLATEDFDFIKEFGAEVIIETARIWLEIGHFHHGKFKIDSVTGPDEYTAIVNNNYYTNVMAKYNLKWAAKLYYELQKYEDVMLKKLCNKLELSEDEILQFVEASNNMYLPYNKELRISAQDDTFLNKAVWDFKNTPKANHPLLLHYHPLTIYRYQVLKQADTVLAHFLQEDEADFETIKKSYDYYENITTHDSSLSCAAYSIMASKIGYIDKAYDYFIETSRLDLDNTHGNTKDGIHCANMGGTWMSIVYGFAGLRIKEENILLTPKLPEVWNRLTFNFLYKGMLIKVDMKKDKTDIFVEGQNFVRIMVNNKMYEFTGNGKVEICN